MASKDKIPVIIGGVSRNGSVGGSSVLSSDVFFEARPNADERETKGVEILWKQACVTSMFLSFLAKFLQVGAPPGPRIWRPAGLPWKGTEGDQDFCAHIRKTTKISRHSMSKLAKTHEHS